MAAVLVVVSLAVAFLLSQWFALVAVVYFVENIAYSFRLKKVAFLDVGLIAFGFVLRVLGGGYAEDVHVSWYLIACTALLALYLGFGKRRHELALENAGKQRAALEAYSVRSLNVALLVTGAATAATYVAYTLDPATRAYFNRTTSGSRRCSPWPASGDSCSWSTGGRPRPEGRVADAGDAARRPAVLIVVSWVLVIMAVVYKLQPG